MRTDAYGHACTREERTWHAQVMPPCTVAGCADEAMSKCRACGAWVCGAHRASELLCAGCASQRRGEME